ncbi:MAG: hypothetical protein GXP19_07145 [Gammaproteobacteria bacterium]|nr:hypothetical protein [Gammaproteobacteria bacterium]
MHRDKLSIPLLKASIKAPIETSIEALSIQAWWLFFFISIIVIISPLEAHAVEPDAEVEEPSIELLEFLADFETEDGRWIDPSVLEAMKETGWSGQALEAAKDE